MSVRLAEKLFAVLFSSDGRIRREPLVKISRLPVCQECLDGLQRIRGGVCSIGGERLFSPYAALSQVQEGGEGAPLCGLCRRIEPPFVRATAYGSSHGGLRELIHLLRYASVREAANVLGRMLAEVIDELECDFLGDRVGVVPVPLHRGKLRQRGALEGKRETPSQTGLISHQRRETVRGAYGVVQHEAVKGREVLVMHDVYTAGATVSECARVLRRAVATKVWVATVARTLKASARHVVNRISGDTVAGEESVAPEIPLACAAGS